MSSTFFIFLFDAIKVLLSYFLIIVYHKIANYAIIFGAEKYFVSNVERRTQTEPEVYIENHNWGLVAYQHYPNITDYYGWWLRTPGESNESMAYVSKTGEIIDKGTFVADEMLSVRPAMWVDLNKVREVGVETMTEE